MAQQEHVRDKIKKSFPYVDILFGTHALYRFPELLHRHLSEGARVFDISGPEEGVIVEGIRPRRDREIKAWLSIMYGCNNYCAYCVVPYVRGRERSREPDAVLQDARELIAAGYKDITLLGQNVNSYGRADRKDCDFSDLLARVAELPGDFRVRFMTSHPKDATSKLFDTMAAHPKICKSLHLPVQSGSDAVLARMNRRYTAARYLELVACARQKMPELTITSDIIVGFPGESEADFEQTLALCEAVRFDSLFTFIYSKRAGTAAAKMDGGVDRAVQQQRFDRLLALQNDISRQKNAEYVGRTCRVLVDGIGDDPEYNLTGRTEGGKLLHLRGDARQIGRFYDVEVKKSATWALFGDLPRENGDE